MRSSLATRLGGIDASTDALDSGSAGSPPAAAAPLRDAFPAVISEADIRAHVAAYGNRERLTPFRTKQILKKALAEAPPTRPGADECCGSACTPCVKVRDVTNLSLSGIYILVSRKLTAPRPRTCGRRNSPVGTKPEAWKYFTQLTQLRRPTKVPVSAISGSHSRYDSESSCLTILCSLCDSSGARPFLVAWQYKMVASVQEEHLIPLLLTTDMRTLLPAAIARS